MSDNVRPHELQAEKKLQAQPKLNPTIFWQSSSNSANVGFTPKKIIRIR